MLLFFLFSIAFFVNVLGQYGGNELVEPDVIELNGNYTTITVKKCVWNIENVVNFTTRCYCYQWKGVEKCTVPGPTLVFTNGTDGYINMSNGLVGSNAISIPDIVESMISHDPDVTNLHTHGLHVDPSVDDIIDILINPGTSKTYPFQIPHDHYPGLHWYHAHWHGSVSLQVHGGLFGAISVNTQHNASLDPAFAEITSRVVILHAVHFNSKVRTDGSCNCSDYADWFDYHSVNISAIFRLTTICDQWCDMICAQRNQSEQEPIQNFSSAVGSDAIFTQTTQIDSQIFYNSKSTFLVNSQYQPTITIDKNQWLRLRILNADSQGSYLLQFNNKSICEYH